MREIFPFPFIKGFLTKTTNSANLSNRWVINWFWTFWFKIQNTWQSQQVPCLTKKNNSGNSHLINLIEDLNWNESIFWDLPTFMIVFQVNLYLVKTFIHRKKEKECSFRYYLAPLHMSLLGGVKNVNLLLFFTQDIFYELLENPIRYRFHDMTRWLNDIISALFV